MAKSYPIRLAVVSSLIALLSARCATSHAPERWLPKLEEVPTQAYGAWATVEHRSGDIAVISSGELIAAGDGNVLLLEQGGIKRIPMGDVTKTRLEIFREKRRAALWAALGTLSTLSHGFGVIISAPIWIVSGIGFAAGESRAGMLNFSGPPPEEIGKFARFPQGLPRGLDLKSLRPKPAMGWEAAPARNQ